MTYKSEEIQVLKCWMSLFRDEASSFDVVYGGLGIFDQNPGSGSGLTINAGSGSALKLMRILCEKMSRNITSLLHHPVIGTQANILYYSIQVLYKYGMNQFLPLSN
jgi:hypothetical protein